MTPSLGPVTAKAKKVVKKKKAAPKGLAPGQEPSLGGESPPPSPAPAPAPAAPLAPPWQPLVDANVMGINATRDIGLAGLDEAEKFLRLDYGLIQQADGSFAVDVNNPSAKAAMLQRSYQQARRGDLNSMAGRGQLNSGAYLRAMSERNRGEQMDTQRLVGAFQQGMGDISRQRQTLQANASQQAAQTQLEAAMQMGGDSASTPVPPAAKRTGPGPGGKVVTKTSKADGKKYVYHYYPQGRDGRGKPEYVRIRPAGG